MFQVRLNAGSNLGTRCLGWSPRQVQPDHLNFAQLTIGVGSCGIEVTKRDKPHEPLPRPGLQSALDFELGFAIRIGPVLRLSKVTGKYQRERKSLQVWAPM